MTAPWKRKKPAGKKKVALSEAAKEAARARAAAAGRRYPNLVDNMWAAKWQALQSQRSGAEQLGRPEEALLITAAELNLDHSEPLPSAAGFSAEPIDEDRTPHAQTVAGDRHPKAARHRGPGRA